MKLPAPRDRWHALGTSRGRPEPGDLVPMDHAVWRITNIELIELNDDDRETWNTWRQPDIETWPRRPYRVAAEHVGGVKPTWVTPHNTTGYITIRANNWTTWDTYPNGRWPQCSCCGEPMPCRAELQDRTVTHETSRLDELASRLPGCCWGCGDPITRRQHAVRYAGDNVDLPGGPPVVYHLRQSCHHEAARYEDRWRLADPTRRRILTYPDCGGVLVSHAHGDPHECVDGDPECVGPASHNHGTRTGCAYAYRDGGCPRGCPTGGSYIRRFKRPQLRDPDLPQGPPPAAPVKDDTRPACHGTLLIHRDGRTDCRGGRDDCWDDTRYRHDTRRDCHRQTHGCPTCEVAT